MSTFHYEGKFGEAMSGVKCDACGFKLYTDTTGFFFGEHMREAKRNGWLITKTNERWLNLCPNCKQALEERKRAEWIEKAMGQMTL